MQHLAVYCGSSAGNNPVYTQLATELGNMMASRGIGLVYGGGQVGLMGQIADIVLASGGEVIGVIPDFLDTKEIGHKGCTKLHVVGSMHERKMLMYEKADAFVAMPGGFGTMDELFEILTWAQLGLHKKPIGLLNVAGYYNPLVAHVNNMQAEGFLKPIYRQMLLEAATPGALLEALDAYVAPDVKPWLKPGTT